MTHKNKSSKWHNSTQHDAISLPVFLLIPQLGVIFVTFSCRANFIRDLIKNCHKRVFYDSQILITKTYQKRVELENLNLSRFFFKHNLLFLSMFYYVFGDLLFFLISIMQKKYEGEMKRIWRNGIKERENVFLEFSSLILATLKWGEAEGGDLKVLSLRFLK
jgi:hypothetical protein